MPEEKQDFINVSGEKVDPGGVEEILLEHPGIDRAAVIGIPDHLSGERVKAFVVARKELSKESIMRHCRERLATFQIPKEITFINELPTTSTGKVLRHKLRTHNASSAD